MIISQVSYGLSKGDLTDSEIGSSTFYVQVSHKTHPNSYWNNLLPSSSPLYMTRSLN